MAKFTLNRRAILRGSSGAALALPFLEIMGEGKARAAVAPKRYVFCYGGFSLTRDGPGTNVKYFTPASAGANYELGVEMSPLGTKDRTNSVRTIKAYDVQKDVSVVSGLKIPWAEKDQDTPPDGHATNFHGATAAPLVCGVTAGGASADTIIAETIGAGTKFAGGVHYQIQAGEYEGGFNQRGEVSFKRTSSGGSTPTGFDNSPQTVFGKLFGPKSNFIPPVQTPEQMQANAALLAEQKRAVERDGSILDLVARRGDRLRAMLGKSDRDRLAQHFDEVRALEKRVADFGTLKGGESCKALKDPGTDPMFDPAEAVKNMEAGKDYVGWSDEDKRAEWMRDALAMTLICDLTRVGVLLITYGQSYMSCAKLCGLVASVHSCGHGAAAPEQQADVIAWHVEQYAWLVDKLRRTPDVDGRTMLDNTIIVFGTEGGWGYDPAQPDEKNATNHSSENMSLLVAGGSNLGFHPGRHIPMGNKVHPASVLISAMKAVGVNRTLGAVTGAADGL